MFGDKARSVPLQRHDNRLIVHDHPAASVGDHTPTLGNDDLRETGVARRRRSIAHPSIGALLTGRTAPTGKDTWSGKLPDTNSGGTDGPFATVTKARDAVKALRQSGWTGGAITVYLRGGVYTILAPIAFASGDSGSASAPITYRAYPGEKPVLQGGRRITGFTALGNGRYTVKPGNGAGSSWYFRELFVGGKRMMRARYPNYVASNPHRGGFLYAAAGGSTTSV